MKVPSNLGYSWDWWCRWKAAQHLAIPSEACKTYEESLQMMSKDCLTKGQMSATKLKYCVTENRQQEYSIPSVLTFCL